MTSLNLFAVILRDLSVLDKLHAELCIPLSQELRQSSAGSESGCIFSISRLARWMRAEARSRPPYWVALCSMSSANSVWERLNWSSSRWSFCEQCAW